MFNTAPGRAAPAMVPVTVWGALVLDVLWFMVLGAYVAGGAEAPRELALCFLPAALALLPVLALPSPRATGIVLAVLRRVGAVITLGLSVTFFGLLVAWVPLGATLLWGVADRQLRAGWHLPPLPRPGLGTRCALAGDCLGVGFALASALLLGGNASPAAASVALYGGLILGALVLLATEPVLLRAALSSTANVAAVACVLAAYLLPLTALVTVPGVGLLIWGERRARLAILPPPPAPPIWVP